MKKAENIFRTPFSTALSGSARETERRIRNIFLWKKKRPPADRPVRRIGFLPGADRTSHSGHGYPVLRHTGQLY